VPRIERISERVAYRTPADAGFIVEELGSVIAAAEPHGNHDILRRTSRA
jgi:hypothetical protein